MINFFKDREKDELKKNLDKTKASLKEIDDYAKMVVRANLDLAKAEEELSKKINSLSILHELGRVIAATFNLSELLKFVSEAIICKMDYEKSVIFLVDVKKKVISTKVAAGFTREELLRLDAGLRDIIFNNLIDKSIVVNFKKDASYDIAQDIMEMIGTSSVIALPLVVRGQTEGVIFAGKNMPYGELSADDLETVSILANQLAIAIENILLYGNLEHKVEERTHKLKETQAQLIQAAKMGAVGQLGAGIAHELNNPIGGILGYAQFMLNKLANPDFGHEEFKSCKKYIELIEKESSRCRDIIVNMLKFSRRSGETKLVDIKHVVNDTLAVIGNQMRLANVNVHLDISQSLGKIYGNANYLQQVVTNIVINAQQAMPNGGDINIKLWQESGKIKLTIKDTGCGIPNEYINEIFEPFFTTKMESRNTGLGLTVSYQIIQDHKGDISVESEPGKGTTFIITLPVAMESEQANPIT